MIMKDLTSVEMSVVSGGVGCTGGNTQMCVSATPKTTHSAEGTCASTVSGYNSVNNVYFYCYVQGGTDTAATMASTVNYCDYADIHYYQDTLSAGSGTGGVTGDYATCT